MWNSVESKHITRFNKRSTLSWTSYRIPATKWVGLPFKINWCTADPRKAALAIITSRSSMRSWDPSNPIIILFVWPLFVFWRSLRKVKLKEEQTGIIIDPFDDHLAAAHGSHILVTHTSICENLRTVPTTVLAHTFCASPDTRISYRECLLIQGYFCAV